MLSIDAIQGSAQQNREEVLNRLRSRATGGRPTSYDERWTVLSSS